MEVLYVLIPIALFILALIIGAFWWATKSGQFDDLEGPAHRILMDDDSRPPPRAEESTAPSRDEEAGKP